DDIPGLMGAMTMALPARSADVLAGIAPGTRVRFELVRAGHDLTVTRLVAPGAAAAGRPGIHDHTPHHGGVVAMVGMRHLEAVAARDGSVRVYLTDVWRRPLPLAGATGTVTVDLPEGRREIRLAAHDGALEGSGPPLLATRSRRTCASCRRGRSSNPISSCPAARARRGQRGF